MTAAETRKLERALATYAQKLDDARRKLLDSSVANFHDAFLDVLRAKFALFPHGASPNNVPHQQKQSQHSKGELRSHRWQRVTLQQFLSIYFSEYQSPQCFASLWDVLLSQLPERNKHQSLDTLVGDEHEHAELTFDALKNALKQHASARLLEKDPFPLEQELVLDAKHSKRKGDHDDELELPKLQNAVPKRSSLPVFTRNAPTAAAVLPPGRHSIAATGSSVLSAQKDVDPHSNTPVLQDFHAEVMKKSRNWLGRWQTRYLFLRWGELEICKKNVSAFRPGQALPAQPAVVPIIAGSTGSGGSAANAAKSKRYPLQTLLSLQIVQLNESDPSKKQALSLHFKQPTSNGGNTTKSLILGCDSSDHLKTIVIQIATFAMLYGLANGQDAASLQKFIQVGANLDVYCLIPSPNVPPFALSPLQLAFLQSNEWKPQSFEATVQLLVRAGADPRSLLHWKFATQVLFSSAYGPDDEMLARRLLMVRESIDGVVFPFGGVTADDEHQWNLLMYFSCFGDVEGARQLLTTFLKISKSKCLKYVDHVNAAGDNALHIAIKMSRNHHPSAEELAMLLVDIGTNNASFFPTTASTSSGEMPMPSITPSLTSSSSYVDSQLIHCCDGNGESVFHLALKRRLWRLVDKLIDCKAIDPTSCDRHGNNSLHVAIKVGSPVPLIARIIQLYRPQRSSAFSSISTERGNLVTTLGYDCRDRRGNDTPLTLAIKYRQQEVVELLLAAGVTPNVGDCIWSIEAAATPDSSTDAVKIGDGDSPLHAAIKSGLQHAAMSLVSYGAHLLCMDSNGASPLALAIRYGMYELSVKIAENLVNKEASNSREREQKQWMDLETGSPVCLLAVKAGQIELAVMLLDLFNSQMTMSHLTTKETLLHILVKNICWLELSGSSLRGSDETGTQQQDEGDSDRVLIYGKEISPTKRKRSRVKSRSDGDLRYLQLASFIASSPPQYSSQILKKASSSDVNESLNQELLERIDFFQQAEEALILGILQRSDDVSVISSSSKSQHAHNRSSFHLAASPSLVVTDHNVDSYTPLHVAAAGGDATSSTLRWFLAFLYVKSSRSLLQMTQALAKTTGSKSETPLHAALASNSAGNGLQILLAMQLARGKRDLRSSTSEKRVGEQKSVSASDSKQIASICSHVYEATTVPDGSTPLHLACRWPLSDDMLHVVDMLFQEDVYAGCWDSEGLTPLHVALRNSCDERLIQLFKRHNQDLNMWTEGKTDSDGTFSARSNNNGFDRSMELSTPKTALMLAIEHENAVAFSELVRCGAQLKVVTPQSRLGLLHFAVQWNLRSKELLESLLGCSKLIEYEVTDCFGRTTAEAVKRLEEQLKIVNEQSPSPPDFKRRTSVVLEDSDGEIASASENSSQRQHRNNTKDFESMTLQLSSDLVLEIPEVTSTTTAQLPPTQSITISQSLPSAPSGESRAGNQFQEPTSFSGEFQRREDLNQGPVAVEQLARQVTEAPKTVPLSSLAGSTSKAKSAAGSPPRNVRQGTTRYLQNLPQALGLDSAAIEYLREEERATLTLVAHEARQEAKDWLKKRIGQKKLLSDARAQLQSFQKHRRTGSGSIPFPRAQEIDPTDGTYAVPGPTFGQESERLLEQYKALAAKRFIDKHVAEAVTEARMEIEREKQALFQETGLYPGSTVTKSSTGGPSIRRERLNRTASGNSSMIFSSSGGPRTDCNATLLSDEGNMSVWWSERGGSSVLDDINSTWLSAATGRGGTMLSESWNGTWLSSLRGTGIEYLDSHMSSTFHSFLETENNDPYGVDGVPGVTYATDNLARDDGDDRHRANDDEDWEDEYMNPLDRHSFSHVIETRNSLT